MNPSQTPLPRIFVQIPCYRDREGQWTIKDLFDKARHPERVFVGVCWQLDPETDQDCLALPPPRPEQVRRVDFLASEAQGLGWARLQAQGLWQGEEYTLQIDSHMRFAQDWDEKMLEELAACPSRWPVLTIYPASYWPPDRLEENTDILHAVQGIKDFPPSGIPRFTVHWAPQEAPIDAPKPTACLAGGFVFGASRMIQDVPSDPEIYFEGEEPNLAVRLFTHGFDLFSPRTTLIYHYYRRSDSRRPWDDANPATPNAHSLQRMRRLLEPRPGDAEILGRFGLGPVRSLEEYELFAGVDFRAKSIATYAYHYPFVYTDEMAEALAEAIPLVPTADTELFLLGDAGVLFSARQGHFHGLSPLATWCWCALESGGGLDELIAKLAEQAGLGLEAARQRFLSQICHWQSMGVLAEGTRLVPAGLRQEANDPPKPKIHWPVLPPLRLEPVERRYRLLDMDVRVLCYGSLYAELAEAVCGHLHPAPTAGGKAGQTLQLLGVAGFHYVVRNDLYPPDLTRTPSALAGLLVHSLEKAAEESPSSLLHVRGGLVEADGEAMLILGADGALLAGLLALSPETAAGMAERAILACPELLAGTKIQLGREACQACRIPLPIAVPEPVFQSLRGEIPALEGLLDIGGDKWLPFPALLAKPPCRVGKLVALRGAEDGQTRMEGLQGVEALRLLIEASTSAPQPATVEDAAGLIGWLDGLACYELSVADREQAVALLAGLMHQPCRFPA